jgi:hypothetical protein
MASVFHTSNRAASRHLVRAASNLNKAGRDLVAATQAAPRYHQKQLRNLVADLRQLSSPVAGLASRLARGGDR